MGSSLLMNGRGADGPVDGTGATETTADAPRTLRIVSAGRRRRAPADWYGLAVRLVLLCAGGAAVYSLYWMVQP